MPKVARMPLFGLALAAVVFGGLTEAVAQTKGKDKGFSYKETLRSTVWIVVPDQPLEEGKGYSIRTGTGSLVDKGRGLVITNYHVVGNKDECRVFFPLLEKNEPVGDKKRYARELNNAAAYIRGRVLAREERCDLALVQLEQVPPGAVALKLAPASVKPSDKLHSIGNPGSSDSLWVYTDGTVRQIYRKQFRATGRDGKDPINLDCMIVESTSPVNPGDSGGPVLNDKGELVAVVQGHLSDAQARSMTYFIDVSEVKQFHDKSVKGVRSVPSGSGVSSDKPKVEPGDKPGKPAAVTAGQDEKKEQFANFYLRRAQGYELDGDAAKARESAQKVIDDYPNSKAAAEAKKLLERVQKK